MTVSAVAAKAGSWTPSIEAIGTVKAANGVDLTVQTEGVVREVEFETNDHIDKDTLLLQLDDAAEQADLEAARAQAVLDQQALRRARELSARGVNSNVTVDTGRATASASNAQVAKLEAVLDQKQLRAPFGGVIGIDRMHVDFTVPEQQFEMLESGQPVRLGAAEGDVPYKGRIIGIDPKIDPATRLVSVRAEIANSYGRLSPGQFARVNVELPKEDGVVTLPQTAVVISLYGNYVYKLVTTDKLKKSGEGEGQRVSSAGATGVAFAAENADEDQLFAKQAFVKTGRNGDGTVEILDGISEGDRVVNAGQNRLPNGTPVTVDNTIQPRGMSNDQGEEAAEQDRSGKDSPDRGRRQADRAGLGGAMNLTELFIRRPVLSTVFASLILLTGFQGLWNMTVREYPEVEETVITVTTSYPGADADVVQSFVTEPIASAVATTENIAYVDSVSKPSESTVNVNMKLGADPDKALTEVLAKVQEARGDLAEDAKDPTIVKGTGRQFAIMYLAFRNPNMSNEELTEYIKRVIRPTLSTVQGVADVNIFGASTFSMRIWIDPVRLAARGLTAAEVLDGINASNLLSAPGKTESELIGRPITVKSTLETPKAFGALPLKTDGDEVVRLRDVADVEIGPYTTHTIVNFDGKPGTFMGILPTPSANPVDTAAAIEKALPRIQAGLPEGITIRPIYNATDSISASIDEVFKTIGEAVLIVVLVILVFLGSFRSVLMPILTIPLSLIGVCFFLHMMDYSINLLSLLAMVLAIGLVVDDAIVVVENIHRHIEEGLSPMQAAIVGMREISVAVVAMTITLAAVFSPLAFTGGLTGALFKEFALTLAGAVVISGIVALTITPMMAARLLKAGESGRFQILVDRNFDRISRVYERLVSRSLNDRPVTLVIVLPLMAVTAFLFTHTPSELAPEEDVGALFSQISAPRYATSEYTAGYARHVYEKTKDLPELDTNFSVIGYDTEDTGFAVWSLKDWGDRERRQDEIKADIQERVSSVPGIQTLVFTPPSLPGSSGDLPISLVLQSTGDASRVYEAAEAVKRKAEESGRFITVKNSLSYDAPQVTVTIDRDRAAALNIPVSEIGDTLSLLVSDSTVAEFIRQSAAYHIVPQVPQKYRDNPEKLGDFFVRSVTGDMVPLSAVVDVSEDVAPAAIEQFNQLNSATISALPVPGVTTGEGLERIERIARETVPQDFFIDYSGQSRLEVEQGSTILIAFGLALLVIYLVLAAQFESFRNPFIVMMTVPLSIFGALLPLNMGLGTLNIYTQVGLITLIGLITKHGILLVEFANQQRALHGLSRRDAIIASAKVRLRPILMTTAAMSMGVVPLILASGAGAAARYSMGLVIFFGILIGTLFTLFIVPMFYTLLARKELAPADETSPSPEGQHATQPRGA